MTIRAPLIYNRPLPGPVQGFIQGRIGGPSGGIQFAGNGQWKAYDYPNPTLRKDANYLAAYLRVEGGPRNATLLKGLDKQFAGPGQWKTYDYPNPRGYEYPVALRTWIDPTKQQLIGKDKQFAGFGQWKAYDYQNPSGPRGTVSLLTWTQSLNQTTLSVSIPPVRPIDWPNPKGSVRNEALGWFSSWNSLLGTAFMPSLSWTSELVRRVSIQVDNPVNLVIRAQVQAPLNQNNWPVPLGASFPTDLRTWISQTKLNLIGQDKFFGGPGQGPANLDWPVPKGAQRSIDLNTWIQNLSQGTLAPLVVMPFSLLDWQNPNGYLFPSDLRTIAQGFSMLDAIPPHPPEPVIVPTTTGGASGVKRYRPPKWWEEGRKRKTEAQLRKEVLAVQKKIETARKRLDLAPDLNRMEKLVQRLQDLQQRLLFLLAEIDDLNRQVEEDEVMKIYTIYRSLN